MYERFNDWPQFKDWLLARGHNPNWSQEILSPLRVQYEEEEQRDDQMEDGGYFTQRFIGGPLGGSELTAYSHEGINDGFWSCEHRVGDTVYTYKRQGGQFEDSDYLLVKTEVKPDPAKVYREREEALRQVVNFVADMGCDTQEIDCQCVTCLALEIREAGRVQYEKV